MYDSGDFIEWLEGIVPIKIIMPSGGQQPSLPYATLVMIVSNQGDIYERGVETIGNSEVITSSRHTQFSLTVISKPSNRDAENRAQQIFNLLKTQVALDWFRARGEAIKIAGQPRARYLIEDDFNEKRIGFDIEIRDVVEVTDTSKEFMETVTIHNTNNFIDDIVQSEES